MTGYDDRPWLALYRDQAADLAAEFDNALDMFRAGVAKDPEGMALQYFDGAVSRRELDELSDALASGLLSVVLVDDLPRPSRAISCGGSCADRPEDWRPRLRGRVCT